MRDRASIEPHAFDPVPYAPTKDRISTVCRLCGAGERARCHDLADAERREREEIDAANSHVVPELRERD